MDPISTFGSVGSSLSATVALASFISALTNTPDDVQACLVLVEQVNDDLQFLIRLRNQHLEYLSRNLLELKRIDKIVFSATKALLEIGRRLEGCRKDANGGKTPLWGRVKWVVSDCASFTRHAAGLQVLQAGIVAEISWLRNLTLEERRETRMASSSVNIGTTYENEDLFYMDGHRKHPKKEIDLLDLDDAPPSYQDASQQAWPDTLIPEPSSHPQQVPGSTIGVSVSPTTNFNPSFNYDEIGCQRHNSQPKFDPRAASSRPSFAQSELSRAVTPQPKSNEPHLTPCLPLRPSISQSPYSSTSSPFPTPSPSTYSDPYIPSLAELPSPEIPPALPARTRGRHSTNISEFLSRSPPSKSHIISTTITSQFPAIPNKFPLVREPAISIRELPSPSCSSDSMPTPNGEDGSNARDLRRVGDEDDPEDAFFNFLRMEEIERQRRRSRGRMGG